MSELMPYVSSWRAAGLRVVCYPTDQKLKKQLNYANQVDAPWVVFFGEEEKEKGVVSLKNMMTGEDQFIKPEALVVRLQST